MIPWGLQPKDTMPTSLNVELEKDDRVIHIKAIGQRGYGRTLPTVGALLERLARKPKGPTPARVATADQDLVSEFSALAKDLGKQLAAADNGAGWFDAADGLKRIQALAATIRKNPKSLGKLPGNYDVEEILDDLDAVGKILALADQRKTRFRFISV
jgi:hypothetical protein